MDNYFKHISKNKILLLVVFLLIIHLYYSKQLYYKVTGGDIEYILGFKQYSSGNNPFWANIVLLMGFIISAMNLGAFIGLIFRKFWGWILSSICIVYYLFREIYYIIDIIVYKVKANIYLSDILLSSNTLLVIRRSLVFIAFYVFLVFCLYNRDVYRFYSKGAISRRMALFCNLVLTILLLVIDRIAHSL